MEIENIKFRQILDKEFEDKLRISHTATGSRAEKIKN